jgi:hypothetical protein
LSKANHLNHLNHLNHNMTSNRFWEDADVSAIRIVQGATFVDAVEGRAGRENQQQPQYVFHGSLHYEFVNGIRLFVTAYGERLR